MQIRHNTKEVEEANRSHELGTLSDIAARFTHFRTKIFENGEVAVIWQKGQEDLLSLSPEERVRFDSIANEFYWSFAMLFLYHDIGGIDEATLQITTNNIDIFALEPGLKQWWDESKYVKQFPPGFVEHVSNMYKDYENPTSAGT